MVKLTYMLKQSEHESVKEAFKAVYQKVMGEESLTEQMLSTIWVENNGGVPLFFFGLCDLAHSEGWLNEKNELTY